MATDGVVLSALVRAACRRCSDVSIARDVWLNVMSVCDTPVATVGASIRATSLERSVSCT